MERVKKDVKRFITGKNGGSICVRCALECVDIIFDNIPAVDVDENISKNELSTLHHGKF